MSHSREPLFHSEITDLLDPTHPLALEDVECLGCQLLVHAHNNENMNPWMETGLGALCLECFSLCVQLRGAQNLRLPPVGRSRPADETWSAYYPRPLRCYRGEDA